MADFKDCDPSGAGGALESRIVTIGRLRFAVGTMWLSWAKSAVSAAQARDWVASQKDVLPPFEALLIVGRADNRTDIGLCGQYQPGLRALSQVIASHPEAFAAQLPSETYRWGVIAETTDGVYLTAASRDGLPLTDALSAEEGLEAAKAKIEARFSDIHWAPALKKEEFDAKLLALAPGEPVALLRASKMKLRVTQALALMVAVIGAILFVRHCQEVRAEQTALEAQEAAMMMRKVPEGFQAQHALEECLSVFQHTDARAVGWVLAGGTCDTRAASFIWRRTPQGIAPAAPPGARVSMDLRTAMISEPLRIGRCDLAPKARDTRIEAAISDWAIAHGEEWRAGGGEHPLITVEGIVPGWEMPIETCARTVSLRWARSGIWRLELGW